MYEKTTNYFGMREVATSFISDAKVQRKTDSRKYVQRIGLKFQQNGWYNFFL